MTKNLLEGEWAIINDAEHTDIVTINNLKAGDSGPVITIKPPKNKKIVIIGVNDDDNIVNAHVLITRMADKYDKAIDLNTEITITHEKSNDILKTIKLSYGDISMVKCVILYEDIDLSKPIVMYNLRNNIEWYRFKNTIILDGEEKLVISAIKPNKDIEKVKLSLEALIKKKNKNEIT